MAYAIENQGDWKMAFLFLSNAVGCCTVLFIAAWKRPRHRRTDAGEARVAAIQRWRVKIQDHVSLTIWKM
jgi:hypothetical protein